VSEDKVEKAPENPTKVVTLEGKYWDMLWQMSSNFRMVPEWTNSHMKRLLDFVELLDKKRTIPDQKVLDALNDQTRATKDPGLAALIQEKWFRDKDLTQAYYPKGDTKITFQTRWDDVIARILADHTLKWSATQLVNWRQIVKALGVVDLVDHILDKRDKEREEKEKDKE